MPNAVRAGGTTCRRYASHQPAGSSVAVSGLPSKPSARPAASNGVAPGRRWPRSPSRTSTASSSKAKAAVR
ncbi:hypothetical protein ACFQ3Z_35835 [Streptomyces nogalater]